MDGKSKNKNKTKKILVLKKMNRDCLFNGHTD
jgi:hypothetical protein